MKERSLYSELLKPLLFLLPAELAHHLALATLAILARLPGGRWLLRRMFAAPVPSLPVQAMGVEFDGPIGLAAGLDKDAIAFEGFLELGFSFVEVGTLTAIAQPGNPKPRLFRLQMDRGLINRMGFNNRGARAAAKRLARRGTLGRIGANIGRSKVVPNEEAEKDYAKSARCLAPNVDYLVVNVSSPNTPGLRLLQNEAELRPLLKTVRHAIDEAAPGSRVPLLVKIAPDLSDQDIDAVAVLALQEGIDGIIATNTTITRSGLSASTEEVAQCGAGGLSGPPLKERSLEVLRRLWSKVGGRVTLISVGGIETAEDVWQRILAGASLVQVYSALIYEGPELPRRLQAGVAQRLEQSGFKSLAEAIGSEHTGGSSS